MLLVPILGAGAQVEKHLYPLMITTIIVQNSSLLPKKGWLWYCTTLSCTQSKVQYWQLIDTPRPISSYCFYKDIC